MQIPANDHAAIAFRELFLFPSGPKRFILGRNVYSKSVLQNWPIDGVIDDFTDEVDFEGVPVVRSADVPKDALVLNASGGRPITAKAHLDRLRLQNLDYFSFLRVSDIPLHDVVFNEGFSADYERNSDEYHWIFNRFADAQSRTIFDKLVGFRSTLNINYLDGFTANESGQYFEDFLELKESGEVFVDVGCFNGFTSLEFAKLAPDYRSIHAFEPDPTNFELCVRDLEGLRDVHLYKMGLSDRCETLRFSSDGSGSKISEAGTATVSVNRMDEVVGDRPTLIKMDIEGAECAALNGAEGLILGSHPRLAICVYHNVGDFHRIPRLVLSMRDDYDIYLRHYTESIYETVMFFIPQN
jgi:FkbM family methyltransferase